MRAHVVIGLGLAAVSSGAWGCGDDDGSGPGPNPERDAGGPAPVVLCGASDDAARDDAVFSRLVGSRWEAGYCDPGGMPTWGCWKLQMNGDGTFTWALPPDAGGATRTGGWNFRAYDDAGGILCLGETAVLGFRYNTMSATGMPVLELGALSYLPVASVTPSGDRSMLPAVVSDAMFETLSEHGWRKTNAFDTEMLADEITFRPDGGFDASYRAGDCMHDGRWGLMDGRLVSWSNPNMCDLRSGPMSPQQARLTTGDERPALDGDLLRFLSGTTYTDIGAPPSDPRFGFVSYSGEERLEIEGTFTGTFQNGVPLDLRFSFRNEGKSDQWMGRVRIRFQALSTYGYPEGMPVTLHEQDFAQATVVPSATLEHVATITPPMAGRHLLDVDVSSSTLRHSFPNGRAYRVVIAE